MDDILLVTAIVLMVIGFAFVFGFAEPPQALSPHALAQMFDDAVDSVAALATGIQSTARTVQADSARGLRELQYARGNMGLVRDALRESQ
ncbi:MAG: hypothetical protein KGZ54_03535 [Dethiobacter sp.]|nr:hypothetical protein [Dethiobacter sp.]MBS3901078.1 hypothetical protein [Dethiobacter sp.]MBS3988892.1 hypothetical protein [Dethiobacter sp.]